jgi:LmbE family N-acetylglucosaminyl deacetylase
MRALFSELGYQFVGDVDIDSLDRKLPGHCRLLPDRIRSAFTDDIASETAFAEFSQYVFDGVVQTSLNEISAGRRSDSGSGHAIERPLNAGKVYNIVFAVCHPDDEALWVGGLLCELSKIPFVRASVICLSGNDQSSPRMAEFRAAREIAGYDAGIVLGAPLGPALKPLTNTSSILEEGLKSLRLTAANVDLLLTHSHYGDEHMHPHHRQAHRELRSWCGDFDVPFGYFSCIPLTWLRHIPVNTNLRRSGTLHLLNWSRCESVFAPAQRAANPSLDSRFDAPKHYLQFQTDVAAKSRMLACYQSIDLDQHERGYAMFTSAIEAIYLLDDRGLEPWRRVVDDMEIPGASGLIEKVDPNERPIKRRRYGSALAPINGVRSIFNRARLKVMRNLGLS